MKRIAFAVLTMAAMAQGVVLAKRAAPEPPPPQPVYEPKRIDAPALLRALDIAPTPEGIAAFLVDVEKGRFAPPAPAEIDRLIAALGSDVFREREQAGRTLASLIRPPLDKLRKASAAPDLEVSRRARHILAQVDSKPDTIQLLFMVVREKKLDVPTAHLAQLVSYCDRAPTLDLAHEVLMPRLRSSDADLVHGWVASTNTALRATGVRALSATLPKADVVAAVAKYLKDESPLVRGSAARTLVSQGELNPAQLPAGIDADTLALVYRAAEFHLRQASRDRVHEPKTAAEYQKLVAQYAETLKKAKSVKHEIRPPANTQYWLELGMKSDKHPEVLLYRIRWFNGQWSMWYLPGYNDKMTDGRAIRFWACFNDHEYEVITTTRTELHRQIEDLP